MIPSQHVFRLSVISHALRPLCTPTLRPYYRLQEQPKSPTAQPLRRQEPSTPSQHLPQGYCWYPNHNDYPVTPPPDMTKVYQSDIRSPQLPRFHIFHYIFPPEQKGRPHQWYETPSKISIGFVDGLTGKELLREEIPARAMWLNTGLRAMGFKKGQVGVIFGQNSLHWVEANWAIQAVGAICSPANAAYGASLVMVQPELVPVLEKTLELLSPAAQDRLGRNRIILMCELKDKPEGTPYLCMSERWSRQGVPRQIRSNEEKDTAYLCYSSGTTGKAKGVMTSHHNMECQVQALNAAFEPTNAGSDRVLAVLPFSHIYGLTLTLHFPLVRGVPVVVLPKFDPVTVFKAIQKYKITFMFCVPPMLLAMMHHPEMKNHNLSSLRGIMLGAAPCDAKLIERFENLFPKVKLQSAYGEEQKLEPQCRVTQGYGLTEASPVTHVMNLADGFNHKGSIGKIMPTTQARLVDPETGKDVAEGERGELWVRGPSIMSGYWKNEEATKKTFAPGGWLMTGDMAMADEQGYFYIVDRLKELIKYKGYQVPPAELEALLLTNEKVADVGVIGIWNAEQSTEMPRAYIVPQGGLNALEESKRDEFKQEIIKWTEGQVSNHKRLRGGVVLLEAIPKSPSGKILRKDLREMAKAEEVKGVQGGREAKL